jgi:hypothetical protein
VTFLVKRQATSSSIVAVLLVGLASACGSSSGEAAPAVTITETSPPSPSTVTVTAPPTSTGGVNATDQAEDTFTMPSLVGLVLQTAQDKLQFLGSYVMDQQDAGGLDRLQLLDSNWKVCSQSPNPGARVAATDTVTLASVKLEEACP